MHGAYQSGLNDGYVPLCIGSHYVVRTKALKEIGGIGPELAEDFSTTFLMNSHGWNGAFVHNAIAIGEGPQTFSDCMKQEFQWSRSLTNLLFTIVPSRLKNMTTKKQLQLRYAVFWYPLIALVSLIGYGLPLYALVIGRPIVSVNYAYYIYLSSLQLLVLLGTVNWLRNQGVYRPVNAKILSWEAIFYNLARWPYIVWGIIHSIADTFSKRENIFKITPKHKNAKSLLPLTKLMPYILLTIVPVLTISIYGNHNAVAGYYYLNMLTSVFYFALIAVIMHRQVLEVGETIRALTIKSFALMGLLFITFIGFVNSYPYIQTLISSTIKGR